MGNPRRFPDVEGFEDRKNDLVYASPLEEPEGVAVFFPGDVQDYIENMVAHRDNNRHKEWNLEDTAVRLQGKFPKCYILVVKPSRLIEHCFYGIRMGYKTFSCFQNFVQSNDLGVPDHTDNYNALKHLNRLLKTVFQRLESKQDYSGFGLKLVGFSKGCVVLNQFVYEFHHFTGKKDEEISSLIGRITDMYWLDGGHSGSKNTWINDQALLTTLCSLRIKVHVHVTPYQIRDERRPWIKKEEKNFSDFLRKHNCHLNRIVHFEMLPPTISKHFEVINAFY